MKKTIFYSLLFFFSLQINAQRDQTLFNGTKLDQSGSWIGFSYTPTEIAGESSVQGGIDVKLEYNNSFILGWQWRKTSDEINFQDTGVTDKLELGYHTFLAGYAFKTYKVIHPIVSVGIGPGNLKVNGDKDRLLVIQPAAGVEINVFRWMRVGVEGGYRYISGNQFTKIENQDLSNYYGTVTFRFGWSWGR